MRPIGNGRKGETAGMEPAVLSAEELTRLLSAEFPEAFHATSGLAIEAVWQGGCRMRQRFAASALRPGGPSRAPP